MVHEAAVHRRETRRPGSTGRVLASGSRRLDDQSMNNRVRPRSFRWTLLAVAVVALSSLAPLACRDLSLGTNLGTKLEINRGQLYYTKQVRPEDAERLGQYLLAEKYFDGTPKTAQIDKAGSTWLLRMVVKAGMDKDESYAALAKLFGMQISNGVFSGQALKIELCDARMKTLRTITPIDGTRIEVNGGEIYYASMVERATADKLGKHFAETGFFDGNQKTVHLVKDEQSWWVRIVVRSGIDDNAQAVREFGVMGLELSGHVFDGGKVVIHLCDDKLVTRREVVCPDGKRQVHSGGELYFAAGVEPAVANELGNYLVKDGFFDGAPKTVRLTKASSGWQVQIVVQPGVEKDPSFVKLTQEVAKALSDQVFDGEKVEVHLCDSTLQALQVVTP